MRAEIGVSFACRGSLYAVSRVRGSRSAACRGRSAHRQVKVSVRTRFRRNRVVRLKSGRIRGRGRNSLRIETTLHKFRCTITYHGPHTITNRYATTSTKPRTAYPPPRPLLGAPSRLGFCPYFHNRVQGPHRTAVSVVLDRNACQHYSYDPTRHTVNLPCIDIEALKQE